MGFEKNVFMVVILLSLSLALSFLFPRQYEDLSRFFLLLHPSALQRS
jgi:hypothetical protein